MCTTGVKLSVKLGFSGVGNPCLALYSQSEVAIPSKIDTLELYQVMKLQNFLSSSECYIEYESKVYGISIEVRNQTELTLVG